MKFEVKIPLFIPARKACVALDKLLCAETDCRKGCK